MKTSINVAIIIVLFFLFCYWIVGCRTAPPAKIRYKDLKTTRLDARQTYMVIDCPDTIYINGR